jgi:anterior pharynx defective protein 1
MTVLAFFGCALAAYGPALALFTLTIANDPVKIIILILSAFFWLLSLLLSSVLWFAVVPLRDKLAFGLVFSVLFQELFRLFIYLLLRKADAYLKKLTENEHTQIFANKHILAYVVGLGFGMMSGAFSLVNVLADTYGPGTVGFGGEPKDFFMASAGLCLATILLHMAWGVITFAALDCRRWVHLAYVWVAHLTFSCLTLLNANYLYPATVLPAYVILAVSATLAFQVSGGTMEGLKSCIPGRPKRLQVALQTETEVIN